MNVNDAYSGNISALTAPTNLDFNISNKHNITSRNLSTNMYNSNQIDNNEINNNEPFRHQDLKIIVETPQTNENELSELFQQKCNEYEQKISQQYNEMREINNENLQLKSLINSKQNISNSKPPLTQICNNISGSKKWIITIILSLLVLFITSTYTISILDNWLDNHGVDLFSKTDRMNELLLLVIQFLFLVIIIRLILQYV